MSEENVEVVRRTLETFNREGIEAALQYFDAEVEWLGPPEWLEQHLYKGHDGIRKIASVWSENFEEYRLDPEELIDAGDQVVALVHQRGRIKGSADLIEQRIGYVWAVRNGKGARVQVYFSWEEALRDAGLG
ncbi:MAG: nuclear transport factor 2 family protein [Actinomycetota bacterium]|nr:nuclear transport factor 2 family protein [Actinomycetota bacterium]